MGLKPCKECGKDVSERAETCPHCGVKRPLQSAFLRGSSDLVKALAALGCLLPLLAFFALIIWAVVSGDETTTKVATKSQRITHQDVGDDWPLTVDSGVLMCENGAVTFHVDGKDYAVNGFARSLNLGDDIRPIWKTDLSYLREPENPVNRIDEPDRHNIFQTLDDCNKSASKKARERYPTDFDRQIDMDRTGQQGCERSTENDFELEPGELDRILDEGFGLGWEPFPLPKITISPLIDIGMELCEIREN